MLALMPCTSSSLSARLIAQGADVVVCQLGGGLPPGGQVQLFDQAVIVQHILLVVSGPGSLMALAAPGVSFGPGRPLAGGDTGDSAQPKPDALQGVDPRPAPR